MKLPIAAVLAATLGGAIWWEMAQPRAPASGSKRTRTPAAPADGVSLPATSPAIRARARDHARRARRERPEPPW